MKKLEFRVYLKNENKIVEMVAIDFSNNVLLYYDDDTIYTIHLNNCIIMQSTSLVDKTGRTIFDGDIVRTKYGRLCEVKWITSKEYCGWDLVPISSDSTAPDKFDLWDNNNLEVIGTIYDNKKLLGE